MCADIADLSRDEAKRILRRLELEAYSAIVSAFRAQGELGRDKKKLLNELGTHLCISTERHRAEVRRAYSDDRLLAISESVYGPGSCAEWAAEGRRTVPLMPRLVPQTVLTATATAAANTAAASNAKLPASTSSAVKGVSSGQNSANSSPGGSTTSSASSSSQQSVTKPATTSYNQQASSSQVSDTENESDNKVKKRRRLSTSMAKPVPRIITPSSSITKPVTKTASVSTMTKVGKPVVQTTTSTKPTQKGTLSASASQVKLLTKTVAITPTLCQAKTVLTYKTVQTASSSPVKVQTVMSSAASKTQIKPAHPSSSPSKSILVPKPHGGGAAVVSKSVATSPGISRTAGNSPSSAIKLGNTTSQLAARQRLKPTRFKTLPGTVKFKSVTPVTVGSSSVVTMVTPSPGTPSSSGSSILSNSASTSQPYLKVIQVPVTGVVGTNKPVVVVSTGMTKTAISSAGTTTTTSRAQQAASSSAVVGQSVLKVPISIAPATVSQSSSTTCVTSSAKSVVVTTVVGGTKRIVLSLPAYSLAQSKPVVTSGLAAAVAAASASAPRSTTTAALEQDLTARGQELSSTVSLQSLGVEAMPLTQGSTQIMPKHVASTLTTQVRSRPLPAILPAPPKPTVTVSGQPGSASAASGSVRKLAPILPAPAKNVTVIQPVLLPVVPVTTSAGQLGTSLPVVLTSTIPSTVVTTSDGVPVQSSILPIDNASVTQEPVTTTGHEGTVVLGTVKNSSSLVTGEMSSHPVPEKNTQKQSGTDAQTSLSVVAVNQSSAEVEPNRSSEDDALLLCSEILDISSAVQESTPTKQCMFEASAQEDFSDTFDCLFATAIEQNLVRPDNDKNAMGKYNYQAAQRDTGIRGEEMLQKENINTMDSSEEVSSLETVLLPDLNDTTMEHATEEDNIDVHDDCEVTGASFDSVTKSSTADSTTLSKQKATPFSTKEHKVQAIQVMPEKLLSNASEGNLENIKNNIMVTELESGIGDQGCPDSTSNEPTEAQKLQACGASKKEESTKETKNLTTPEKEPEQLPEGPSVIVEKLCDVSSFSYCTSELLLPLGDSEKTQQLQPKQLDDPATTPNPTREVISIHEGGNGLHLGEGEEGEAFLDPNTSEEVGELIIEGDMCKSSSDDQESHESLSQDVNVDILSTGSSTSSNDSTDKEITEKERRTLEAIANVRTSGRKRKAPMALDVSPPRPTAGWVRSALSNEVQFRNGPFFMIFTTVDPSDAPGYYKIIKTPMDFSTIRAKLESGQYQHFTDFYADMILVKTNCQKYNPPGHEVRQDCDEVFKFFETEYAKLLERWEKCHTVTVSPAKKVKAIQPKVDCATK